MSKTSTARKAEEQGAQPAGDITTAAAAKRAKEKIEGGGTVGNEFRSAALGSGNAQPAGSGGPFDPANTAKAHMSEHQMRESESVGNPTTGGMTPKISPETVHLLSERDREALAAMEKAKTPEDKDAAARSSTGVVSVGSEQILRDAKAEEGKRTSAAAAAKAAQEAQALTQQAEAAAAAPGGEQDRQAVEEARHKEALEVSKQRKATRAVSEKAAAAAKKKPAAKTAPAAKAAPPAKKAVAKKAAAKKVSAPAKKTRRH